MYIGIDFGTTYSALSIYTDDGNRAGLLPALFGYRGVPTQMRYDGASMQWYYGEACKPEHYPNDTVKNIKAKIRNGGDIDERVTTGGYRTTFKELLKNYLSWLIKEGIKRAKDADGIDEGEQIEGITVTVPCGFTGKGMTRSRYGEAIQTGVVAAYKEVIESGIRLARIGNPTVKIIEEPVAAAMEYLMDRKGRLALDRKPELNILVVDLGGGTLDVTVIKCIGHNKFKVVVKGGDLVLGGNNFDDNLLNLLIRKLKAEYGDFSLTDTQRLLDQIRVTETKELLSERPQQTFGSSTGKQVLVTRQEFENATSDLLQRVKSTIKECVNKSGGIAYIDKIVLVGGSCRMPQIKNGIKSIYPGFSDEDIIIHKPSYSIANGAAYCAAQEVEVADIATCTYGFRYRDSETKEYKISNLIFMDEDFVDGKIEHMVPISYIPIDENQQAVTFTAYESTFERKDGDILFDKNIDRFNANGLQVTVAVPEEYYLNNKSKDYDLYPKMILTSNGILKLEIYHNGEKIGGNQISIK